MVSLPQTEVDGGTGCEVLKDGVEREALNLIVVVILKQSLSSVGPDDYAVISTTSGKLLAILLICNAVHGVTMTAYLLDHLTRGRIINEDSISNCHQDLGAVRTEANGPHGVGHVAVGWRSRLIIAKVISMDILQ